MDSPVEVWKPVAGYEGAYEISSFGRFAATKNGERFIRKQNSATTYLSVSLKKMPGEKTQKSGYIHKMVAEAFIGKRPDGCVIRHIDGDRYNNRADNLCYGTPEENNLDDIRNNTHRGVNNGNSVLNEAAVRAIKLLIKHRVSQTEIAHSVGLTVSAIHAIKTGRNWGDISID